MIRTFITILCGVLLAMTSLTYATNHTEGTLTQGEVRKVDMDAKKITISHEPIQNLDMPAMTMVFQAKDPAMLKQVRVGDKVKFEAQKLGGAFMVTRIEPAK